MGVDNLEKIFSPQSVAVVGASDRGGSIGHAVLLNLLEGGYQGRIYPVNPNHRTVLDLPAYPELRQLPERIDLAVFSVPIHLIPGLLSDAVDCNIGGTVILSAGGKETGRIGRDMEEKEGREQMLGVARVITLRDLKSGEFAILVGDPWQGKGIGAALLMRCLDLARQRGIETVCGEVLAENTQMLALGRKLGFKTRKIPGSTEYEMYIDLKSVEPFVQGGPP